MGPFLLYVAACCSAHFAAFLRLPMIPVYLYQDAVPVVSKGPSIGMWEIFPQSLGGWIGLILSCIAVYGVWVKRVKRDHDLDGLGGRTNKIEVEMHRLEGSNSTLLSLTQTFVSQQAMMNQQIGEHKRAQQDLEHDNVEIKEQIVFRLDKMIEKQGVTDQRVARVEALMGK